MQDEISKEAHQFDELLKIIRNILKDETGCARAQNDKFVNHPEQILSELNELKEAISKDDVGEINEELGHVLFDVIYLAILGEKENKVKLDHIFKELNWAMKFRHPHVFEKKYKTRDVDKIKTLMKDRKEKYHNISKQEIQTNFGFEK